MKNRYLILLITLALFCHSVSVFAAKEKPCNPWPHCDGGDGGNNTDEVYSADLTGDFDFFSVGLTSGRKGKSLSGNDTLVVVYNGNAVEGSITGGIFGKDCWALLTKFGVDAFEVSDDWGISYTRSRGGPDQIHITMNDLIIIDPVPGTSENYSQVDFDLHLHGEIADGEDFLPDSGSGVSHHITKYMLWAGGHEEEGWFICNSTGGGMDSWESLPIASTLTITR